MKHNPGYMLLSHCSVSLHNTKISFSAAFINIACRQTKNCNNFCPKGNLKIQCTMARESTVTLLLPFPEKITILKLLRGGTTESRLNIHTIKATPMISLHRTAHESFPRWSIRTMLSCKQSLSCTTTGGFFFYIQQQKHTKQTLITNLSASRK